MASRKQSMPVGLSIVCNLSFQDALRTFADAQTDLNVACPRDKYFPVLQDAADEATAFLVETIDRIIAERRLAAEREVGHARCPKPDAG